MVAKGYETGDLVWAKMKGFPPWPGKIIAPPKEGKPKKSQHYIFFYGSDNHAWIADENISMHSQSQVDKYTKGQKRPPVYLDAVEKIINASKSSSKYQKPKDSENSFEKIICNEEPTPKGKSPHSNSIAKKSEIRKKVPVKKSPIVKRDSKKRSMSSDHNGSDSGSIQIPSKILRNDDDDFSNLMANIPPNYSYKDDSRVSSKIYKVDTTHQPAGILSRNVYVELPDTPPINLSKISTKLKENKITPTKKKIGFLGLGKMGQGIVKNLLHSDHSVTLWNRTLEKSDAFVKIGAKVAKTPFDVVLASDITFCCVSDPEAAKSMVFGNWGVLKALEASETKNKGYVEMTSLDPNTSQASADEVVMKGGRYLEAPLHGSRAQAEEGTLFILCGGDKSLYEECKSCFAAIGRNDLFMSRDVGTASKYNIIHSMLLGTVYAAMAESLALIERVDLKQADFLDILQYGILNNAEIVDKGRSMIETNYASDTPLKHQQKELKLGLSLGSSVEQPMPITAAANEVYKHCKLLRYADHDVSAIFEGTKR